MIDRGEATIEAVRSLYLDLIERCLLNTIYEDPPLRPPRSQPPSRDGGPAFDQESRLRGRDWPSKAHTMIGRDRMANVRHVVEDVIVRGVPGDLIETGVWRGGACIYMRAILKAWGATERRVWVADSFEGLPPPDPGRYPADAGSKLHRKPVLAVSLEEVKSNFAKYGLLDDQVRFLKGWFKDSLPSAPIERLAVLRLDGDMYESTMDGLASLYDKVSPTGYVIVDDFHKVASCRQAVLDFREQRGLDDEIETIDRAGVFWQKTG